MSNLIELAVINKLRFPYKGLISVESLFDLPSSVLKNIGMEMENQSSNTVKSSRYSTEKTKEQALDELRHQVLGYVIEIKEKEENEKKLSKLKANEAAFKKELALQAKLKKEVEKFENMSEEELEKYLAE